MNHNLVDGVEQNKLYPGTFHIPSEKDKSELKPGDNVKLGFVHKSGNTERMWVNIHHIHAGKIRGNINNDPVLFNDLKDGDSVEFEPRHVLNILTKEEMEKVGGSDTID